MRIRTRKDLGLLMRELRRKRHLTQAQLAGMIGVNRRWVVQVEQAKTSPDLRIVLRALRALGTELHAKPRHLSPAAMDVTRIVDSGRSRRE